MARILVSLAQGCEELEVVSINIMLRGGVDVVTDSAMRGAAEMGLQR